MFGYNKCIIMSIGRDDTLFVKFDEFKLVFMCICFDCYLIGKCKGVDHWYLTEKRGSP